MAGWKAYTDWSWWSWWCSAGVMVMMMFCKWNYMYRLLIGRMVSAGWGGGRGERIIVYNKSPRTWSTRTTAPIAALWHLPRVDRWSVNRNIVRVKTGAEGRATVGAEAIDFCANWQASTDRWSLAVHCMERLAGDLGIHVVLHSRNITSVITCEPSNMSIKHNVNIVV